VAIEKGELAVMIEKGELATSVKGKKRIKTKFIDLEMTNYLTNCFYLWDVG